MVRVVCEKYDSAAGKLGGKRVMLRHAEGDWRKPGELRVALLSLLTAAAKGKAAGKHMLVALLSLLSLAAPLSAPTSGSVAAGAAICNTSAPPNITGRCWPSRAASM